MERNLSFDTEGLEKIAVHLGWAQLEMFADEVDKVQVMAAGEDSSVEDLRIAVKDGCLTVEQPQYGLSLNIMECRWLQVWRARPQPMEGRYCPEQRCPGCSAHENSVQKPFAGNRQRRPPRRTHLAPPMPA